MLVGPRSLRNVRLERSGQEVMEVSTNFAVYSSVNAENARQADSYRVAQSRVYRKGKGKNRGALVAETPTTDDSIRQLGSELLTERSVKFARYVNGRGYELHALDEASPELIAEEFSLERDQKNLAQDMANAVDYLRQPASSYAGVRKLQSTDLRLNGKRHSLWRLAPDKAPGLKVEGNNRYYRLVYTIIDGSVVVYDIVSHADFDKKYST